VVEFVLLEALCTADVKLITSNRTNTPQSLDWACNGILCEGMMYSDLIYTTPCIFVSVSSLCDV